MDSKSCLKSSDIVLEAVIVTDVKGETSDSVSKENDSRIAKDGVRCSNISTQAIHENVMDNVTDVSFNKTENDTSYHMVNLSDNEQRICRICHFGSNQSPEDANDSVSGKSVNYELIEIGCKCKNELGLAHFHCAETWFKLKGNSICEICGCTAKNVTVRLMERDNTLDDTRRRGRGQSCCIFIVFLFTIILLHWFFKKFGSYYNNT